MRTRNRAMRLAGLVWVLLLSPVAMRPAAAQQGAASVSEGARVYGKTCGRCHNPRSPLERSDRSWVTIAAHMRIRANLTEAQMRHVVAFLQATNTDPGQQLVLPAAPGIRAQLPAVSEAPPSTAADLVGRGEALVAEKACLGCHVIGQSGGQVGPRLTDVVARRGPVYIRRKLTNPTFDNPTSMMPNFGLTPDQIEAILAYLAAQRP